MGSRTHKKRGTAKVDDKVMLKCPVCFATQQIPQKLRNSILMIKEAVKQEAGIVFCDVHPEIEVTHYCESH
jgi:uncharacterized protein (DUF2225 family)